MVTALYDAYDELKPVFPQDEEDVDWVCVTDRIPHDPKGWRIIHDPLDHLHPNRAAKFPKMFPWDYTDADRSVWIDASFRVTSPRFTQEALSYATPIAQFVHPWRDCIYDEAEESSRLSKYTGEDFGAQTVEYVKRGHPEHWGLWATGIIARKHTDDVRVFGSVWDRLIKTGTFQDQVSEPVALRDTDLRPNPLPGTHFSNPWLTYEGSVRHL